MWSIHVRTAPPILEVNDPGKRNPEILRTTSGRHARVMARPKHARHHVIRNRPQSDSTQEDHPLKVAAKVPGKAAVAVAVENR